MESLFIEIDKEVFGTSSNIVIGAIYVYIECWTLQSIFFGDRINVFNIIQNERKLCCILGNMNIDSLK